MILTSSVNLPHGAVRWISTDPNVSIQTCNRAVTENSQSFRRMELERAACWKGAHWDPKLSPVGAYFEPAVVSNWGPNFSTLSVRQEPNFSPLGSHQEPNLSPPPDETSAPRVLKFTSRFVVFFSLP